MTPRCYLEYQQPETVMCSFRLVFSPPTILSSHGSGFYVEPNIGYDSLEQVI